MTENTGPTSLSPARRNWREHTYPPDEMTEEELTAETIHLASIHPQMSHYSRDAVAHRHDLLVMEYRRRRDAGEWNGPLWAAAS